MTSVRNPTIYPAALKEKTAPVQRHFLLTATVLLLPFSYAPHEIVRTGPNITFAVLALTFITGAKYGVLWRRTGPVDMIAIVLALFVAVRLLVLSPLQWPDMDMPWDEAAKAVGTLVSGVVLLRIAQREDLRPVILSALRALLVMLLMIEAYQLAVGLPRLFALGYVDGFYYYTEAGSYRPFGTFLSPTVFGAYLAVVGAVVVATSRGKAAFFWSVAVAAGLVMTETRAAWIAFASAMLVVLLLQSRKSRAAAIKVMVPTLWIGFIALLAWPHLLSDQWERLQSVTDTGLTSNSSRLELWSGTLQALGESPLIGYAPAGFNSVMYPFIGPTALLGHAHNNYLQIAYMYGIWGLALVLALLLTALAKMRGAIKAGLSSYALAAFAAVVAFLVDSFFETTWTSLSFVSTLFLVIGLGLPAETKEGGRRGALPLHLTHGETT